MIGDDVSDFLDNKKQLKPRQYEGNVTDEWDIVINRDPKPFKLSSNLDEEEIGEMSLGLPVSQDVVFSKRRSVEDNILLRLVSTHRDHSSSHCQLYVKLNVVRLSISIKNSLLKSSTL